MNYYNELDPKAAAWLRELISEGLIPKGEVDTRSIRDVQPGDLDGFTQCHFFAGIGGWSLALRLAGWPEDRPVWTGSCPCQPFSCAGKGLGTADERHLWPAFRELIRACKPSTVIGEQVASKAGREWLAGVFADLEGMAYQRAGADLCAASVGAPHIRQRLWWVAYPERNGRRTNEPGRGQEGRTPDGRDCETGGLAHAEHCRHGEKRDCATGRREFERGGEHERLGDSTSRGQRTDGSAPGNTGHQPGRNGTNPTGSTAERGESGRLGDSEHKRLPRAESGPTAGQPISESERRGLRNGVEGTSTNHFWSDAIWHHCRDGKARRIPSPESIFQLESDGIWRMLGNCWNHRNEAIETAIINYAKKTNARPGEALRTLWMQVASTPLQPSPGGHDEIPFKEVLLFALCQLAGNQESVFYTTAQDFRSLRAATMRAMWGQDPFACSSQKQELARSPTGEFGNTMHKMPSGKGTPPATSDMQDMRQTVEAPENVPNPLSAVEEVWRRTVDESNDAWGIQTFASIAKATSAFPLTRKIPGRVGLLRGAGNAICVQTAQAFIESVMEILSERHKTR